MLGGSIMKKSLAIILLCIMLAGASLSLYAAERTAETTSKKYTITKVVGETVYTQKVKGGNRKGDITFVKKSGKLFAGWYTDKKKTKHADFSDVDSNMKVYAKYVKMKSVRMVYDGKKGKKVKAVVNVKVPARCFRKCSVVYSWPVDVKSLSASPLKTSYNTFAMNTSFDSLKSGREVTAKITLTTWDGSKVKCPKYIFLFKKKKFIRQ